MIGTYKLIFDLAFYYTLTGFYLNIFTDAAVSAPGFVLLCIMVFLNCMPNPRWPQKVSVWTLLLPLLSLIKWPGMWAVIHLLPVWAYAGYCVWSDRTEVTYGDFHHRFGLSVGSLCSFLLAFLLSRNAPRAFVVVIPYLIMMLVAGVCLLRLLRENTASGGKQALIMIVFVVCCGLLTAGKAPQMLMAVVGFVYEHVIAIALLGVILFFGLTLYGLFAGIAWLASLLGAQGQQIELDLRSVAEQVGLEAEITDHSGDIAWLRILGYILLAVLVTAVLVLIFRRLLGDRRGGRSENPWSEQKARLGSASLPGYRALVRPREPRLAVRYYYSRFLQEADRRGMEAVQGSTAEEIVDQARMYFPGADPQDLTAVYAPARYCHTAPVTQADVTRAQAAWRRLKKTKPPV